MGLSSLSIRGWGFVSEFLDRPHTVVRLCFRVWNLCSCSADSGPCAFSGPRCSVLWIVVVRSSHLLCHVILHNAPSCKKGGVEPGKWERLLLSCRLWIVESWNMIFLTMFGSHAPRVHQDCGICNLGSSLERHSWIMPFCDSV